VKSVQNLHGSCVKANSPEAFRLQIREAVREVEEAMEGEDSETIENLAHRLVIDAAKKLLASPAFQTQQELHVTWYAELEALREKQEQLFSLAKEIEVRQLNGSAIQRRGKRRKGFGNKQATRQSMRRRTPCQKRLSNWRI
jgi:hypothetical protein